MDNLMILSRCYYKSSPSQDSSIGSTSAWYHRCHGFKLEVCIPKLFFETRQDQTGGHFLNWRYQDKTNVFWSRCSRKSGKIWEKFGKNLGRDKTNQYHSGNSWMALKWTIIQIYCLISRSKKHQYKEELYIWKKMIFHSSPIFFFNLKFLFAN